MSADFTPCSPHCPSVTGKPYGTVHYCPMTDMERHRNAPSGAFQVFQWTADGTMQQKDWTLGLPFADAPWVDASTLPVDPDYGDCCANFQCCDDGSLGDVLAAIVGASAAGGGVVHVVGDTVLTGTEPGEA